MKKILSTILALVACTTLLAQDFKITHGPWLCDLTSDGVTVVWTTSKPALSWVEVAEDDGRSFYAAEHERRYETVAGRKQAHKTLHSIRLKGLRPGTKYRYRIFSQEVREWKYNDKVYYGDIAASNVYSRQPFAFRTLPASGCDLSFVVLNDIHGRDSILRQLLADAPERRPDFVCFNGDMLTQIESVSELFDGYLDTAAELLSPAGIPIFATRGNHENRGSFSPRFLDYFPTSTGEVYYTFRQGPAYFVVLDCGEDKPDDHAEYNGLADYDAYRAEECAWLKKAVRSEEFLTASARIVLLHIPPAAGAWHGSVHLNELFVPVLNEAGIDLMLCGHDHRYSFHPAGERDAKFPIVVNDNRSCVRCDVADSLIRVRIAGPRDKTVHTHEFPLKPQFQP